MFTKVIKLFVLIILMATINTIHSAEQNIEGAKGFLPQLLKITINGKLFYQMNKITDQHIIVDSVNKIKIKYVFKNIGANSTTQKTVIFVHFMERIGKNGEIVMNAGFSPKPSTLKWDKNFIFTETRKVDFKKIKHNSVEMCLGLYIPDYGRLMINNGKSSNNKKISVGFITVK